MRPAARALLAALLLQGPALAQAPAGPLERQAADASAPFDNPAAAPAGSDGPAAAAKLSAEAKAALQQTGARAGKAGAAPKAPAEEADWRPKGLGPVSTAKRPSYGKGLLGGLLGLVLAPLVFAWEALETVVSTPVRMVKGLASGDPLALLEPLRTAKNLVQDAVMVGVGMLSSASAPVWNAIYPDKATDFQFSDHRLIFSGGPFEKVLDLVNKAGDLHWSAAAPSMHTVFLRRSLLAEPGDIYKHEYVHGIQWRNSFAWEKQNHDFVKTKDYSAAEKDLNW